MNAAASDSFENVFSVVMAGGSGTRFWPVSRELRPKQLLSFFGERSLLEETVARVRALSSAERTVVVTSEKIAPQVRSLLTDLPPENVLAEPMARNTAAAIGFAAVVCKQRCPDAILAVMPSDHHISAPESFERCARTAIRYAAAGYIATLGLTPTRPETGYGYIRLADFVPPLDGAGVGQASADADVQARHIGAFIEKPDVETALRYLREGRYLWNSGMFFFSAKVILDEITHYLPELAAGLSELADVLENGDSSTALAEIYSRLQSVSIDYGVMEHTSKMVVIPANIGWSDVGTWGVLSELGDHDDENAIFGDVIAIDAKDNVLYADGDSLVAAVGVEGLVVAASGRSVLVCPKGHSQQVRKVVEELKRKGLTRYS